MKNFLPILFLLFVVLLETNNAQWIIQHTGTSEGTNSVDFINENTGWITASNNNYLLKTTDGGNSWNKLTCPANPVKVQFIDEQTGFLVVHGGSDEAGFYKTTNGGTVWKRIYQYNWPKDLHFLNKDIGLAICDWYVFKTTDGGASFEKIFDGFINGTGGYITQVIYVNTSIIWLLQSGGTYYSSDGGKNWVKKDYSCNQVCFLNASIGWCSFYGDGNFYKTLNGGVSWEKIYENIYADFTSIRFLDEQNGFSISGYSPGMAFNKTTDGGHSWQQLPFNGIPEFGVYDYDFVDKNNFWVVGTQGTICKYDSSKFISIQKPGKGDSLYSGYKYNIQWYYSNLKDDRGKIEYSTDSGISWNLIKSDISVSDNQYLWNIPDLPSSNNCLLRFSVNDKNVTSVSKNFFKIIKDNRILSIDFPKGGEIFHSNDTIKMLWNANYSSNSNLIIDIISLTDNSVYGTYEAQIREGKAYLILPYYQGTYKFFLYDKDYPYIHTESQPFKIKIKPGFYFYQPDGRGIWLADSSKEISLSAANIQSFQLGFSTDSCKTWSLIKNYIVSDSNEIKDFRYTWKIPHLSSKKCFIKATSLDNPAVYKISNMFVIDVRDISLISYFPLQKGNIWQFKVTDYSSPRTPPEKIYYHLMKVAGDTSIKSVLYRKVSGYPDYYLDTVKFLRYDLPSNSIIQYSALNDKEIMLFSFNSPSSEEYTTIMNESIRCKLFIVNTYHPGISYTFAKGFGPADIIFDNSYIFSSYTHYELVYAKIDGKDYRTLVTDIYAKSNIPEEFVLTQNYPNPFNPLTTIKYSVPRTSFVSLEVYDILGKEVAQLVDVEKLPGNYEVKFDGSRLTSGIYFYKIQAGSFTSVKKMILIK